MLPDNLLTTLRALSLNERLLPAATPDKDPSGKSAFEVGQRVQGTVLAETNPGVFKVRVLDQMLHMQLPATLKSGDVVELQVMSLQPRLTFSMAASATPLSTPEQLSSTARLLSSLTQKPPEQGHVRPLQAAPLWDGVSEFPKTSELAGKLHESLSQSGLFYESHQAQWITGSRSTAQLLQEPQNQPAAVRAEGNTPRESASGMTADNRAAAPSSQVSGMPEHVRPLVQQQLNALETRQVLWQGQAWPNQEMSWEIHDEGSRRNAAGELQPQWATQIRLDLPHLGEVAAMLRFGDRGVSLTLDAADPRTRELLGTASSQLVAALAAQGIPVGSAMIARHEQPAE